MVRVGIEETSIATSRIDGVFISLLSHHVCVTHINSKTPLRDVRLRLKL